MESRAAQPHHRDGEPDYPRHSHHRPSAIGHWTRALAALVPLGITELVEDRGRQIRFTRIASVALLAINELSYAYALDKERREREQERRECRR
jgi:hypothetical protein